MFTASIDSSAFADMTTEQPKSKYEIIGTHVAAFNKMIPTEQAAVTHLYKRLCELNLLNCRNCRASFVGTEYKPGGEDRVARCRHCNYHVWFTANTFFEGMRYIRPVLGSLYLLEKGIAIASSAVHHFFGIAQSSAYEMLAKIRLVISKHMDDHAQIIPTTLCKTIVGKRSRFSPRLDHPRAEYDFKAEEAGSKEEGNGNGHAAHSNGNEHVDAETIEHADRSPAEQSILAILRTEKLREEQLLDRVDMPISEFNSTLVMMELDGLIEWNKRREIALRRKSASAGESEDTLTEAAKAQVKLFLEFCAHNFHSVSKKNLEIFSAQYWLTTDRERWTPNNLVGALFCSGPVHYKEVREFYTDDTMRIYFPTETAA